MNVVSYYILYQIIGQLTKQVMQSIKKHPYQTRDVSTTGIIPRFQTNARII